MWPQIKATLWPLKLIPTILQAVRISPARVQLSHDVSVLTRWERYTEAALTSAHSSTLADLHPKERKLRLRVQLWLPSLSRPAGGFVLSKPAALHEYINTVAYQMHTDAKKHVHQRVRPGGGKSGLCVITHCFILLYPVHCPPTVPRDSLPNYRVLL